MGESLSAADLRKSGLPALCPFRTFKNLAVECRLRVTFQPGLGIMQQFIAFRSASAPCQYGAQRDLRFRNLPGSHRKGYSVNLRNRLPQERLSFCRLALVIQNLT
jgi:hypothetical protein